MAVTVLPPGGFPSGKDSLFLATQEAVAYPLIGSIPAFGTVPTGTDTPPYAPALVGVYDPIDDEIDEAIAQGNGAGSAIALYTEAGMRKFTTELPNLRLTSVGAIPFLATAALQTEVIDGSGPSTWQGTSDLALLVGHYLIGGQYVSVAKRFAKFKSLDISAQEGENMTVMANCTFWSLYEQLVGAPYTNPSVSVAGDATFGTPLSFLNRISIVSGGGSGYDIVKQIAAISVSIVFDLEYVNPRIDKGDNAVDSRIATAIKFKGLSISGKLTLHTPLDTHFYNAAAGSTRWGDIVAIFNNTNASTAMGLANILTLTINNPAISRRQQRKSGYGSNIQWEVPFTARNFAIAAS